MNKASLQDISFLIPVRLDSVIRLENLMVVIDFLHHHLRSPILVLEASAYKTGIIPAFAGNKINYWFEEDRDDIFHRTKYINTLVGFSTTPYVAIWDCDDIIPPKQIFAALKCIKDGESSFVFPYAKEFLDTGMILREIFIKNRDHTVFTSHKAKMMSMYGPDPIGGAFLANLQDYKATGIENPNFYGWGREDGERIHRWKGLGYNHNRIDGPLFHLSHPRGINSSFHSNREDQGKWNDILYIKSLGKKELNNKIQEWSQS